MKRKLIARDIITIIIFCVLAFSILLTLPLIIQQNSWYNKVTFETVYNTMPAVSNENVDGDSKIENYSTIAIKLYSDFDAYELRDEYLSNHNIETVEELFIAKSFLRREALNYYSELRMDFAKKYNIEIDTEISSPYLEFLADDKIESIKDINSSLKNIFKDYSIEQIAIINHVIDENIENDNSNETIYSTIQSSYQFQDALKTTHATGTALQYDGNGVVVGVLEATQIKGDTACYIDTSNNVFGSRVTKMKNGTVSSHATGVASIIAGRSGIAKQAQILSAPCTTPGDFSGIQWMLDNNVDVVNFSGGIAWTEEYATYATMWDRFIKDNFLTLVVATGNAGGRVAIPAICNNAIAVGATDYSGTQRAYYSNYTEPYNIAKPNLVAPGDVFIPDISTQLGGTYYSRGTSFAAPIVTGAITLAIQSRPALALYPERIQSLVAATADEPFANYNSFYAGFENQVGAGMLNVERLLNNLYSVVNYTFSTSASNGSQLVMTSVYLSKGQKMKVATFWFASVESNAVKVSDIDLHILFNGSDVKNSRSAANNMELIDYTASESGTYQIVVYLFSKKTTVNDLGSIAYAIR